MMVMKEEINVGFTTLLLLSDYYYPQGVLLVRLTRTSPLANDQLPFPPICDGLEKCGLGQRPRSVESDNPRHQNEKRIAVAPALPSCTYHLEAVRLPRQQMFAASVVGVYGHRRLPAVVRASVAILKSAKGRDLRAEQRRCASLVLRRLQVSNAEVCTIISGALLFNHKPPYSGQGQ
ncbi:hypothetical protein EmuJ_000575500 [Echinococcus multilocularis]|uniref:Uncharacterized protein n=1 Tax=Echinococcus multilocularis TaxID=6211 RepID=A0A068Y7T3_ECHMU|nr:hypothetical protein EmuJ_000575500 [Echinococcus multilocularis]